MSISLGKLCGKTLGIHFRQWLLWTQKEEVHPDPRRALD